MHKNGQKKLVKPVGRRLPFNRQVFFGAAALVVTAFLLIIGLYPRTASAPELTSTLPPENADAAGTQVSSRVESGCELIQQMTYSRCGHDVTRRTPLPEELVGKNRQEVEAAYEGWQVIEFLPKRVTMAKLFDLFCANHVVVMPDESGVLGVYENKYGDAMAFMQSLQTPLNSLPDSMQEEVRQGKGFESLEDVEEWLENIES